ncbi:hypothetical protein LOTGIDRAFT_232757 [Lottia gigantea]|uniref:Death domain-containing protein n=1 Tax=Lottia gigantea TaxID=225164 RepID=V3ZPR4_LOTGI|nr:hypothetical protein LOTGIDRAFT_232757 [Lottia gigantea]ESO93353.1 hypothetical protein LOTGIDRAFT_232757 [Lottia gigantea]
MSGGDLHINHNQWDYLYNDTEQSDICLNNRQSIDHDINHLTFDHVSPSISTQQNPPLVTNENAFNYHTRSNEISSNVSDTYESFLKEGDLGLDEYNISDSPDFASPGTKNRYTHDSGCDYIQTGIEEDLPWLGENRLSQISEDSAGEISDDSNQEDADENESKCLDTESEEVDQRKSSHRNLDELSESFEVKVNDEAREDNISTQPKAKEYSSNYRSTIRKSQKSVSFQDSVGIIDDSESDELELIFSEKSFSFEENGSLVSDTSHQDIDGEDQQDVFDASTLRSESLDIYTDDHVDEYDSDWENYSSDGGSTLGSQRSRSSTSGSTVTNHNTDNSDSLDSFTTSFIPTYLDNQSTDFDSQPTEVDSKPIDFDSQQKEVDSKATDFDSQPTNEQPSYIESIAKEFRGTPSKDFYTFDNSRTLALYPDENGSDWKRPVSAKMTSREEVVNMEPNSLSMSKSFCQEVKYGNQNVVSLQISLQNIFQKSGHILGQYKEKLSTEQLKDFALNLTDFHESFVALSELFASCESLSQVINKDLKDIRHVTDDVCNLINRKFRDEDLVTWVDHTEKDHQEKERLEEERIATDKALLAKAAEARASSAKAVTIIAETDKIIADSETEAVEAELAAKRARELADDVIKAAEDARRAAEERRKAEMEAKRRADEKARVKAEEERQKKEEETKRIEAEARKRGTSFDVEKSREEEEKRKREAERKNPNNWPRYIYSIESEDFNPGIGCIIRSIKGSLDRDDIEVNRIDQITGGYQIHENEELISNIIVVKQMTDKNLEFEEPLSIVMPHCAPRSTTGREPVMKCYDDTAANWVELQTNDVMFDDIKDLRFVEARVTKLGKFVVVYRLKKEQFTFTKKGGKQSSTVDSRFTLTTKPGAFRYNLGVSTEIQPVDSNTVSELRQRDNEICGALLASTSIITMTWKQNTRLSKPITITLPCPPNPARIKRPSTAVNREKVAKQDARPQTARPASEYFKHTDDAKLEEELHLVIKDNTSGWLTVPDVVITQAKNKDIISLDITEPITRFVVLRTKMDLAEYQAEKMVSRLEKALLQRTIQLFLRQNTEDLNEILVSCANTNKIEKVLKRLDEEGYDEGPPLSKDIIVREGQVLELRFRGNLAPVTEHRTKIAFNSHINSQITFRVEELDKFAQRGFDSYRGFCQVFTDGLVPKVIQEQEERDTGKGRNNPKNTHVEMVEGEILLGELLMNIPKPEPEPPRPLVKAPVSIKPEGPVNEDVFRFISREVGDEWRKLAQYLNVRRMRIQAILRQNVNSERQQTIYDMLVSWAKRVPRAMDKVEMLCHALSVCGRGDLVEILRERNMEFKREKAFSAKDSYLRKAFIKISRDEKVSGNWKVLAKGLGLTDQTLRDIEGSRPTRQDRCFYSLQKWRDIKDSEATIPNLSQKLRECRYRVLAREVEAIG